MPPWSWRRSCWRCAPRSPTRQAPTSWKSRSRSLAARNQARRRETNMLVLIASPSRLYLRSRALAGQLFDDLAALSDADRAAGVCLVELVVVDTQEVVNRGGHVLRGDGTGRR